MQVVRTLAIGAVGRPRWHPGGRLLGVPCPGGEVWIIDADAANLTRPLSALAGRGLAWSASGKRLLLRRAGHDALAENWQAAIQAAEPLQRLPGHRFWHGETWIALAAQGWRHEHLGDLGAQRLQPPERWLWARSLGGRGVVALKRSHDGQRVLAWTERPEWMCKPVVAPTLTGPLWQACWDDQALRWMGVTGPDRLGSAWTFPAGWALDLGVQPRGIQDVAAWPGGWIWWADEAVLAWDATEQQFHDLDWPKRQGRGWLAWNPVRQWLAVADRATLKLLQLSA